MKPAAWYYWRYRICFISAILFIFYVILCSCRHEADPGDFTKEEKDLINDYCSGKSHDDIPKGTMRVLTIQDSCDNAVLRTASSNLSSKAMMSEEYAKLAKLMIETVTHPSQDGVGIAGPQVGLNRRVIAVQRFDKGKALSDSNMTYPFEVYPNIRIVWASDSLSTGPEGCLSVPDRRGNVARSQEIIIEYSDLSSDTGDIPYVRDTVKGFTAVIFQHEIDHLDGILYIDHL